MRVRALGTAGAMAAALMLFTSGLAAAEPATEITVDGLYLVNVDLKPGTYLADGTPDPATGGCWWRRLWHAQTESDYNDPNYYIIASDFTRTKPVRVVIEAGDVAFSTQNCGA
ncbi:hypothetical protein [Nocardia crassostreae]|uniref:hypothetical protein n=1 Tax=Nocardia crassostreae TaxID=53428 RepID=UPI000B05CD63|nr:hypothetical protein [Nocardia crassostreae]